MISGDSKKVPGIGFCYPRLLYKGLELENNS